MSDTPLTDNLRSKLYPYSWESSYWQMKSHAESLERQLAESRDTVRKMEMAIQHHERQLAEVTKQRDALGDTLKSRDADLAYRDDEWNKIRGQRDALANAIINAADVLATLKGDKP